MAGNFVIGRGQLNRMSPACQASFLVPAALFATGSLTGIRFPRKTPSRLRQLRPAGAGREALKTTGFQRKANLSGAPASNFLAESAQNFFTVLAAKHPSPDTRARNK
jgi:hypothetical protein